MTSPTTLMVERLAKIRRSLDKHSLDWIADEIAAVEDAFERLSAPGGVDREAVAEALRAARAWLSDDLKRDRLSYYGPRLDALEALVAQLEAAAPSPTSGEGGAT